MSDVATYVFQFGAFKTLPLYCVMAKALEDIAPLSKFRMSVQYVEPDYVSPVYPPTEEVLNNLGKDSSAAATAVNLWSKHISNFMYFVQFKDDADNHLIQALHDHTETLSIICDTRLGIDPTPLWSRFDFLFSFKNVHQEYREDDERDAKWENYAQRLKRLCEHNDDNSMSTMRLIQRMTKQIEIRAANWATLPKIHSGASTPMPPSTIELFYSYSHKDETLRDQLQNHLSLLKRQGIIKEWHDRRISAGREWEGQIDGHLNSAQIILLLISADFMASDYCYDLELKRAMERHSNGEARVIPVILRACDWHSSSFGKLQAAPQDGEPVTSWKNIDEAFTDVAKKIRIAVSEILAASGSGSVP